MEITFTPIGEPFTSKMSGIPAADGTDAGEATRYLVSRDMDARALRQISKAALVKIAIGRGSLNSESELRRWSADELISSLLDKRYPLAIVGFAIHVRTHTQSFPDCPHCQADQAKFAEDTFALIERSEAGQR